MRYWSLLIALSLTFSAAQAQPPYEASALISTTEFRVEHYASGDLNGDGHLDFVIATRSEEGRPSRRLTLLGKGDGTFQYPPSVKSAGTTDPWGVSIGDFDNDGLVDVVETRMMAGNATLLALKGDGSGALGMIRIQETVSHPGQPHIADFDGDGYNDVFVASRVDDAALHLGSRDGSFLSTTRIPLARGELVDVRDLDGDGILDIILRGSRTVSVHRGTGRGPRYFGLWAHFEMAATIRDVAVGEFHNDGALDLAVITNETLTVFPGRGDGTFQNGTVVAPGSNWLDLGIEAGDVDGDGLEDLVLNDRNSIKVLKNEQNNEFSLLHVAHFVHPRRVKLVDVNADERLDLVFGSWRRAEFNVSLGNGDGSFGNVLEFLGADPDQDVTAHQLVDLDADGFLDLVTMIRSSSSLRILKGDGLRFVRMAQLALPGPPTDIDLADLNADGFIDLLVSSGDKNGHASVFLARGAFEFPTRDDYDLAFKPVSILAGSDAGAENVFVVGRHGSSGTWSHIRRYSVEASGQLTYEQSFIEHTRAGQLGRGDFNGDGSPDWAMAAHTRALVFLSSPEGFQRHHIGIPPISHLLMSTGDLNRDGFDDLVVTGRRSPSLPVNRAYISMSRGDGSFEIRQMLDIDGAIGGLDIADVDLDGNLEIVVASQCSGRGFVDVYYNLQGNGFRAPTRYGLIRGPSDVSVGDVNGDGRPDLVVSTGHGGIIEVLPTNGTRVLLEELSATPVAGGIVLSWRFGGTESQSVDLTVMRSSERWGTYVDLAVLRLSATDFEDGEVKPGQTYWYRVAWQLPNGGRFVSHAVQISIPRVVTALGDIRLVAEGLEIHFSVSRDGWARLRAFDVRGRLVRTIDNRARSDGLHRVVWDRMSSGGSTLARGVYFLKLDTPDASDSRSIIMIHR